MTLPDPTLCDRARAVGLTSIQLAREAGIDRMTVQRFLAAQRRGETRGLQATAARITAVIDSRERQLLMRLLQRQRDWLNALMPHIKSASDREGHGP